MEKSHNLIYDIPSENRIDINSPLPLYEVIKDYYSFWFNFNNPFYYNFSGTVKLYEAIKTKKETPRYEKWLKMVESLKNEFKDWAFFNGEDNRPSYTLKIVKIGNDAEQVAVYISMSVIGDFYTQIITVENEEFKKVFVSPCEEVTMLFLSVEKQFKTVFENHLFVSCSMLRMNFFGLILRGINEPTSYNGLPNKEATVMKSLFFDFDVLSDAMFIGDKRYKSEHLTEVYDQTKNDEMRELLTYENTSYNEI
jgi:hypothetical protein